MTSAGWPGTVQIRTQQLNLRLGSRGQRERERERERDDGLVSKDSVCSGVQIYDTIFSLHLMGISGCGSLDVFISEVCTDVILCI